MCFYYYHQLSYFGVIYWNIREDVPGAQASVYSAMPANILFKQQNWKYSSIVH